MSSTDGNGVSFPLRFDCNRSSSWSARKRLRSIVVSYRRMVSVLSLTSVFRDFFRASCSTDTGPMTMKSSSDSCQSIQFFSTLRALRSRQRFDTIRSTRMLSSDPTGFRASWRDAWSSDSSCWFSFPIRTSLLSSPCFITLCRDTLVSFWVGRSILSEN